MSAESDVPVPKAATAAIAVVEKSSSSSQQQQQQPQQVATASLANIRHLGLDNARLHSIINEDWDEKMRRGGIFRYDLEDVEVKNLDGWIVEFNPKRGVLKRTPVDVKATFQQFDDSGFHFLKCSPQELVCVLNVHDGEMKKMMTNDVLNDETHLVFVNVSPVEKYNVLVVPHIAMKRPQQIDLHTIEVVVKFGQHADPLTIIGFNSMAAGASVNHLHFHSYLLPMRPPLMDVRKEESSQVAGLYLINGTYPIPGFAFDFKLDSAKQAFVKVLEVVRQRDVPHNLIMFGASSLVYFFPRLGALGQKSLLEVNIGLCEVAGHFGIKQQQQYDEATGDHMASLLKNVADPESFEAIVQRLHQ